MVELGQAGRGIPPRRKCLDEQRIQPCSRSVPNAKLPLKGHRAPRGGSRAAGGTCRILKSSPRSGSRRDTVAPRFMNERQNEQAEREDPDAEVHASIAEKAGIWTTG